MNFGEKLRKFRQDNNLTQVEFAKQIGVGLKTLSLYENSQRFPRKMETYQKIANVMNCDYNYLLEDTDEFLARVAGEYGQSEARKAKAYTEGLSSLFAGGELSDEDKDAAFQAITKAYWAAKEENKKYGRRKKK
jgi:transcriptional regulator with XRE-family HTH domain